MSDKLFRTLAYVGGAAAIYSGMKKKKKADRNRVIAEQAALRAQQQAFSSTANNTQQGPNQTSNSNPSQGSGGQTGATVNSTITGTGSYQMTADTNASLPVLYGQCQVRGSVVGSELESNTVLKTALVLGETTGGVMGDSNYALNKIFWNDAELTLVANGAVRNATLSDGTVTTKYDDKINVTLYQNDMYTPFANVLGITPDYSGATKPGIPKWNTNSADYKGRGALWAFVDMTYDAPAGVQGLGTFTFDITNQDYSNPANVIYDYLENGRYGHGYPTSSIDSGSFFSGAGSLRNVSDELRFFTSNEAADNANVDISNSTLAPQFVTTGNSFSTSVIAFGTQSFFANTAAVGETSTYPATDSVKYNRLKILWANGDGTGNVANINTSLTSNNSFTAMLDIARVVPDGAPYIATGADAAVVAGETYPGDNYNYGTGAGTAQSNVFPGASIVDFLREGDKIRPEGSPYIYTVAENVTIPSPGYRTFQIPVLERINSLDFANTTFNQVDANASINTTLNVPGANSGVYATLTSGPDIKGIYQIHGFPFNSATATGSANASHHNTYDIIPDAVFSNVLIGNTALSSSQEDLIYLGQEKQAVINGLLSTEPTVQQNLNTLLQHSGATLTWDLSQGKWKVIPNTGVDTANAFVFNDDNIIGEIRVTTSDLSNFYNSARASYVEKTHNSVKEETIIYTPDSEKAVNETPHKMEMNYPLCSSGTEATRKVEQELIQNRYDLTVNFTADYSAITVAPGDVVKVTNAGYGFDNKLFRVLKTTQDMDDDILVINVTLLEWNLAIFKERIPFKKPALDDIAFEPETYTDNTDGAGIRPESIPSGQLVPSGITPGNYSGQYQETSGGMPYIGLLDFVFDTAGRATSGSTGGANGELFLGGLDNQTLLSKNLGAEFLANSNVLTSLGGGTHVFEALDSFGLTAVPRGNYIYSGQCMPQGTLFIDSSNVVGPQAVTIQHQTTVYVGTANSNTAYTSNLDVSSLHGVEGGYGNSLDFTVPENATYIKVKWQASAQSASYSGINPQGFDNIRFWCLKRLNSTVE